jgi:peptidoglycan/LPS O-acetylase OafA/YrhL
MFAKLKKWEIKPSTGNHFDVLDGLRGVAILLVVSHHTFYANPQGNALFRFVMEFVQK